MPIVSHSIVFLCLRDRPAYPLVALGVSMTDTIYTGGGADVVLHQAAIPSVARSVDDPILTNDVNVNGTLNMLIAAREAKVKRFVAASSSSLYGESPTLPKVESMAPDPISPYGLQKLTGETYLRLFYNLYGLHTVRAALDNRRREKRELLATPNALARLRETGPVVAQRQPRTVAIRQQQGAGQQDKREPDPTSVVPLQGLAEIAQAFGV